MTEGRKTTETVKLVTGNHDDEELSVFERDGIFGVKGREFYDKFMARAMLPRRAEIAGMLLASHVQKHGIEGYLDDTGQIELDRDNATRAFQMADEFIFAEIASLDFARYWNLYLEGPGSKDGEDVLRWMTDRMQDYSL